MFDELNNSIKANLYERATSPLFGTFVISWVLWNYKAIFVLMSSMPIIEKFDYIETFLYSNIWSCISITFVYPLASALLFIFIYPYPALFVYKFWHEKQKKQKEAKQLIEDETPLTIEESRNIRRELFRLETEYDKEVEKKENEINRMKNIIDELNEKIKLLTENSNDISKIRISEIDSKNISTANEDEIKILHMISDGGGLMTDTDIINNLKNDKVNTKYVLENLDKRNLIKRSFKSSKGGSVSELTTLSKKLMVDMDFVS